MDDVRIVDAAACDTPPWPGEVLGAFVEVRDARKLLPHQGSVGHRDAARAIAEEIARMPSPDEVARQLPEYAKSG